VGLIYILIGVAILRLIWLYIKYRVRYAVGKTRHHEKHKGGYIYWFRDTRNSTGIIKIGRTKHLHQRLSAHRTGSAYGLDVVAICAVDDDVYAEGLLHDWFNNDRIDREWFRFTLLSRVVAGWLNDKTLQSELDTRY
jgi:hypothetical protein